MLDTTGAPGVAAPCAPATAAQRETTMEKLSAQMSRLMATLPGPRAPIESLYVLEAEMRAATGHRLPPLLFFGGDGAEASETPILSG